MDNKKKLEKIIKKIESNKKVTKEEIGFCLLVLAEQKAKKVFGEQNKKAWNELRERSK